MSNVCDFGYKRIALFAYVSVIYIYLFFKSSSLFIENLRDIGNCQLITFSWPKLIWHQWSFAWFEDCNMKSVIPHFLTVCFLFPPHLSSFYRVVFSNFYILFHGILSVFSQHSTYLYLSILSVRFANILLVFSQTFIRLNLIFVLSFYNMSLLLSFFY